MSRFTPDPRGLEGAMEAALVETVLFLQDEILKNTPRDIERLPLSISRKDGKPPHRSTHYKPVNIGGKWYAGVSGALKRSIAHEKAGELSYRIGVSRGPANEYAGYLEFGTRRMRPRSFLRKTITEKSSEARRVFQQAFKEFLRRL